MASLEVKGEHLAKSLPKERKLWSTSVKLLIVLGLTWSTFQYSAYFSKFRVPSRHYASPSVNKSDNLAVVNPAEEWQDEWPYHEQEPWDISTDFPYPKKLAYEVDEGTWLRLDVHPKSGEIVFDMLGDIYCLSPQSSRAHAILRGIPHDTDPHFNPEGNLLAFRSDAELGVDNIWIMPWSSCEEAALHEQFERQDEVLPNYEDRHRRRLLREGRLNAWRVTNETFRFVTDSRFHPSGHSIIATKWYTSARTIPAGEGWKYDIPSQGRKVSSGSGKRIIERTLPPGWSAAQYGDQQIGPEQFIWKGSDTLIYSKRVVGESSGTFEYNGNVNSGIYGIFMRNLTTGNTETLVSPSPGGASRPELSRDGTTLAFVRRVRDKEALVLMNLLSGTTNQIWYGLTYDATPIAAPMGTYPSFAFTPKDDAIIIWAAGKIWRVPLAVNSRGEKVSGGKPTIIPFKAKIEKHLAETWRPTTDIRKVELANTQRVYAFKELAVDSIGERVLFQAAGTTYLQKVGSSSAPLRIPVLDPSAAYYSPSFIPNTSNSVIHAKWSETNFTTFEIVDLESKAIYSISKDLPMGRYIRPVVSGGHGNHRKLAFVRLGGDLLTGEILETRNTGIFIADVVLPGDNSNAEVAIHNLRHIPSDIRLDKPSVLRLRFLRGSDQLLIQDQSRNFLLDLQSGPNQLGQYSQVELVTGKTAGEIAISQLHFNGTGYSVENVAFVDFYQVFHTDGTNLDGKPLRSKPGDATPGVHKVSVDAGHDLAWSEDGQTLFWLLGRFLLYINIKDLSRKRLPSWQEVAVYYESEVARLKQDARAQAANDHDQIVGIVNATLLTMQTGHFEQDLVEDGVILLKDGQILAVGPSSTVIPPHTHIINAGGGLVIPGYIDVHAHWNGFDVQLPSKSWEMETFLAYGTTTLHNPSSFNRDGYHERFLVESGKMLGPRIFHTGNVIYGGGDPEIHQDIVNMDEARSALIRIKEEGGPSSFSYKNYQLPSRASRQRLLLAARDLSMLAVPEGGMNYDWDITYIIDGMATVEHAIPIPVLHDDVLNLYAYSGTAATPTHIVNYGGVMGEQLVWATVDVANDPKLRHLTRHDYLQVLRESTKQPLDSFALFNTSVSVAKLVRRGTWANIGAHGEPPLGLMYHAEMQYTKAGGLTPYEVLRAATRDGALSLGLFQSIGSLSEGKLADLIVYPEGVGFDYIQDDFKASKDIRYVIKGGRVYDVTMNLIEEWPIKGRKQVLPVFNAD